MATISATTSEKVFAINAFRGLNQNPDGDTKLKLGEASIIDNFRITRDGNLQRRPGTHTEIDMELEYPVKGLWTGFVGGHEYILGACNGKLYKFWADTTQTFAASEIGAIDTTTAVTIFPFSNIVYILDGKKYRQWDGTTYKEVEGYVPLVYIAIPPANSVDESSVLENVNRLTAKRRVWLSPDGAGDTFQMPEKDLYSIDYAVQTSDGTTVVPYVTPDATSLANGTITFTSAPGQAVNSIEVGYTVKNDFRSQVEGNKYAELFAGQQDTRVFLYGDGTNRTIYSGIDYNGDPRADYYPDLYECRVGDANTPITGMIRHYSSLVCYKTASTWMITATSLTLADNLDIPAFYVQPVNREIGNAAPGQVRLVLNSPYSLFGNDVYQWTNSSYYTSNLTSDERQAKRISDRVWAALDKFSTEECYCFDHNAGQEYYVCWNNEALVYNYAADAWTHYKDFPVSCMISFKDEVYIGTPDGKLKHLADKYLDDDDVPISAYWESGSMGFNQDYMRKYSAQVWVAVAPEGNSEIYVSAITDRQAGLKERVINVSAEGGPNFGTWSFLDFSFGITQRPKMKRLKIKAKKFVYYKLTFSCIAANTRATVLAADIRVRFTGMAK
jgi:hypothetical protein